MSERTADIPASGELRRSRSNRMLAGVAGGLGAYFELHPAVFRVSFVVLTLMGGAGILIQAGAAGLGFTLLAGVVSLVLWLAGMGSWCPDGWTLGLFFLGSVQLLMLGIVGEYLNRIYEEVRNRPRWIIDRVVGAGQNAEVTNYRAA